MKEVLSIEEFRARCGKSKRKGKGKIRGAKSQFKNDWERMYAERLEVRKLQKEIVSWKYEHIRLKLADGANYTPDFQVVNLDGTIEFHEVKGFRRTAAILRFKFAAKTYPEYTFILVERFEDHWCMRSLNYKINSNS